MSLRIQNRKPSPPKSPKETAFGRKKVLLIGAIILTAVSFAAAFVWLCLSSIGATTLQTQNISKPVVTVELISPAVEPIRRDITVTGTIAARDFLEVGSEASGLRIEQVYVEEGDAVRRGQMLARLNTSVLEATLHEETALLRIAKAQWQKSFQPNRVEVISAQRAAFHATEADITQKSLAIARAKAEYDNALSIASRYDELYKEGAATAQDTLQKRTDVQSYLAAYETAKELLKQAKLSAVQMKEKLNEFESGGRLEDITVAEGEVDRHKARIEQLRAQIEQSIVKAPDDGVVIEKLAHIGDISSGGKPLFRMVRRGELELEARLPQDELRAVRVGQSVQVTDGKLTTGGTVRLLLPQVEERSRLGKIRITIPHSSGFVSGMFVTGIVATGERSALTVPEGSLVSADGEQFVFAHHNGIVRKRSVKTGLRSNHLVEVLGGLRQSDQIVSEGTAFLTDGDVVKVSQR